MKNEILTNHCACILGLIYIFIISAFSCLNIFFFFLSAHITLRTSGVLAKAGFCLFTFTTDDKILEYNKTTQNTRVSYGSLGFCCLCSCLPTWEAVCPVKLARGLESTKWTGEIRK